MKTYNVKTPISHDGEEFLKDDEIELEDEHAESLLAVGAIEDPAQAAKSTKPERQPKKVVKAEKKSAEPKK